jgi:uncharacterized protein (DUF305 family)
MTQRRTILPLALALAAVAAIIAGCGGSDDNAKKANEVDRAFASEMIDHHQMAVDMADVAESRAQHPQIKSTAGNIVRTQTAEMNDLADLAGDDGAGTGSGGHEMHDGSMESMEDNSSAKDTEAIFGLSREQMGMTMDMDTLDQARAFDRTFIDMMIPHHQGAIRMAHVELAKGNDPRLKAVARGIVAAQTKEIRQMNAWRTDWYGEPSPAGGVPAA